MLLRQALRTSELLDLEPNRFPELDVSDIRAYVENGFTVTLAYVHMYGPVVVAIEEEPEAIF